MRRRILVIADDPKRDPQIASQLRRAGLDVERHADDRAALRASGSFDIPTVAATIKGIRYKHCRRLPRGDGYTCTQERRFLLCLKSGVAAPNTG
ncbi:MAG: hypothetical protein HYV63_01855 [Candidatus Schekmanbacteria bacterium]|nr:hypothetical protein [Candidatus Schekmanbacteria bacterium]